MRSNHLSYLAVCSFSEGRPRPLNAIAFFDHRSICEGDSEGLLRLLSAEAIVACAKALATKSEGGLFKILVVPDFAVAKIYFFFLN